MLGAGLIQMVAWHYSTSFAGIVCFAVAYGLVSFSSDPLSYDLSADPALCDIQLSGTNL